MFHVDRMTIYHWFDAWETRRFPGLYDRKGTGRLPSFTPEQKDEIRQWAKLFPKNLNKIGACIRDKFGLDVSKQTIKRVLKSFAVSWRRMRKKVKHRPDPETYQEQREALATLIEEEREGIIDLRYCDASGFCFVPSIPYAWQEKGETIAIESMPSKRVNVLGFLNKQNELDAYTFEGTVDSEVVIGCVDQFCEAMQGPTVVVMDNASIHTSEAFQEAIPKWERKGLSIFWDCLKTGPEAC